MIDQPQSAANDYSHLGPLGPLMANPQVTEIMVMGVRDVYVEVDGKIVLTPISFANDDELMAVIRYIVEAVGRRISAETPLADARLADGSRVHVAIPPVAVDGPLLMSLESGFRPAVTNAKAARTGLKVRRASAHPAAILSKRVIPKYEPPTKAASPADAIAISLSERGRLDPERVASLLGIEPDKIGEVFGAGERPLARIQTSLRGGA